MSCLRIPFAMICFTILFAAAAPGQAAGVQFSQQPAQVGDFVAQQIDLELDLSTSIIQSGQLAHQENLSMVRHQQRLVEILEAVEGKVRRARVTFSRSRLKTPENKNSEREVVEPVEGKTYLLTRQGKQLLVTDTHGVIPPRNEFGIVLGCMQSLGLPNLLTQFLLTRTVHVGETLELPKELAEQMLGFGDELGEVKRFDLKLKELSTYEGEPCAVFAAKIEVAGSAGNPMQINITGPVVILTSTCRTVVTDLTGPLSFDEIERTSLGSFQYRATGTMRAAVRARYTKRAH